MRVITCFNLCKFVDFVKACSIFENTFMDKKQMNPMDAFRKALLNLSHIFLPASCMPLASRQTADRTDNKADIQRWSTLMGKPHLFLTTKPIESGFQRIVKDFRIWRTGKGVSPL